MAQLSQKIVPNLWFDNQAEEAARWYASLFDNSKIGAITRYGKEGFEIHGQPEGQVMTVDFQLSGYRFIGINGGPIFKFTPAMSFFVVCTSEAEIDSLWRKLIDGGMALMPLDKYDWSTKYGWAQDRYGLSWQISLGKIEDVSQKITPAFLFVGDQNGRAEEAITFYSSIFSNSKLNGILRYGPNESEPEGTIKHAQFSLNGEMFMAMDSSLNHQFTFNEAISLLVECKTQAEIDYYWDHLSQGGDPAAQQCGWLKDKFGVSWQVSPSILNTILQDPDKEKIGRVTKAYLQMKKFDIAELMQAFEGP